MILGFREGGGAESWRTDLRGRRYSSRPLTFDFVADVWLSRVAASLSWTHRPVSSADVFQFKYSELAGEVTGLMVSLDSALLNQNTAAKLSSHHPIRDFYGRVWDNNNNANDVISLRSARWLNKSVRKQRSHSRAYTIKSETVSCQYFFEFPSCTLIPLSFFFTELNLFVLLDLK